MLAALLLASSALASPWLPTWQAGLAAHGPEIYDGG